MPPSQFTAAFLPCPTPEDRSQRLASKGAFSKVPARADTNEEIYKPMAAALDHATKHKSRCPGFVFEIAATHSVRQDRRGFMKPDICCYTRSNHDIVRAAEPSCRVDFGFAELFIDISPDPARDAFTDPPRGSVDHELLSFSPSNRKNVSIHDLFGQHVSYVAEIFDRQPRCFLFTIIMHGSRTRLLRWDRAGCVVTEGFDVRTHPDVLCEFLWRFSQTTDAGRGHDTSLQIADYEDLEKAVGQHYVPGRVYTTDILHHRLSAADENTRKFVFSRPAASSRSLAGPGTRGYWAVDVTMKKIVFIKDTWRHSGVEEVEGDTLRRLDDMGVRFVPSFVWHGDVSRMEVYPEERRRLSSRHFTAFPGFIYDLWIQFLREHSSSLETNNRQEHMMFMDDSLQATSDTNDREPLFPDTTTGERAEAIARQARRTALLAERAREKAEDWPLEVLNRSPADMKDREGYDESASEDQTLGKRDRSLTEEQPSPERRVSKRLKLLVSLAKVRAAPVTLLSSHPVGSVRRDPGNPEG
ncbi:uncharacterized protein BXZ73DRAFT_107318 [Epithele typhae]|uniref:uncharacterized protein n=1 Tax=Epithele typhae TaxID=378194 RepID=UPI0020076A6C|nr:uncharacterized protein BXZ73DRAFT_107318 [Epithele typhae]KAH9912682.1 hypothetical protein BXZ73DRAFT_107318 [Epithele typhae]